MIKTIIDIHTHPPRDKLALESLVEAARNAGVDKMCLLPLAHRKNFFYTSAEMKRTMQEYPDVAIGFCAGRCTDPEGTATLEESVKEFGIYGMKIHYEENWELRGLLACHPLLHKAGELGVPVVIHSWHEEEGLQLEADWCRVRRSVFPVRIVGEIARQCPDTTFIFAHMGGHWEKALQAAKPYENISFDTCGFDPIIGVVERAVEVVGPERVLFGSDAPGRNFVAQLAKIQYADIDERDRRMILGDNAARLLRLK